MIINIPRTNLPDPTCGLTIGNDDIKRLLLYSFVRYDEDDPKSITPFFILGTSGQGKSHILRSLRRVFGCPIYNKDAVTQASLASLRLKGIFTFDELQFYSLDRISALLPVFGVETIQRARRDIFKDVSPRCLPIGTLLTNFEDILETSPTSTAKKEVVYQLIRRSVILSLEKVTQTTELQREYIEHVLCEKFNIETGKGDSLHETAMALKELLLQTSNLCNNGFDLEKKSIEKIKDYIAPLMLYLRISDTVSYEETLPYIIINLAQGCALCHNRNTVKFEDVKEITDILVKHAKILGLWREPPKTVAKLVADEQSFK